MKEVDPAALLDPEDREIVLGAFEQGYFETPASTTVRDIAAEFDITDREAKERLARGLATLIREYRSVTDREDVAGLLADTTCVR